MEGETWSSPQATTGRGQAGSGQAFPAPAPLLLQLDWAVVE